MSHKDNMIKIFKELSYTYSVWDIFSDFLEVSALSIANACDKQQFEEREKQYLRTIGKYNKDIANKFPELFAELSLELEDNPRDVLGELFIDLKLNNKWKGQFFTPMHIAKFMAEIEFTNKEEELKNKDYITVCDPCVGAGSLVIAFALVMKEKNLNYQKDLLVQATDIDIRAVYMSYIQLSLLGIPAVVLHGDSLLNKVYSEWKTPFLMMNPWRGCI